MKLNLVDKLFGKKEKFSHEIRFDELPGWLEPGYKKLSEEVGRRAASLYSDIEAALSEIKKSTDLLEEAKPEGKFHLKMVKIATSNRDNMVKQVKLLINNITVPETMDVKTILVFHENAMQTLTVCLENMMKSYQYAKLVFIEESKEVIADVNALGRLLNQLIEPINENKKVLDAFEKAGILMQNIKNMYSDIEREKKVIKENDAKIILLKKKLEEAQKHLTLLKDSEQWKQNVIYKNDLAELENRAQKIEAEINGLVLPLNKALGRLKQLSDSGRYTLAPDLKKGLHLCLSDPKCVNPEFLVEFQKIVKSDTLSLAPDKRDKMIVQIKVVESSFDSYKQQYQTLIQDIETKKSEISKLNVNAEEKRLTEGSEVLQDKLAFAERELEISRKHLASLEEGIDLKKQELQQNISAIDSRMRVSF